MSTPSPAFTAILFGLSGCLVDFGARTAALALQRLHPNSKNSAHLCAALGGSPLPEETQQFQELLREIAPTQAEPTPGTPEILDALHHQGIPCAWLDELPTQTCQALACQLPEWLNGNSTYLHRPWPAPDAIWVSLMALNTQQLEGCILVSGEPRLLQAGLNAGIWTIGLALSGSLCGMALADWHSLSSSERDQKRSQATLSLYRLGVHSVIDQLSDLPTCLDDIALRRQKGEKP